MLVKSILSFSSLSFAALAVASKSATTEDADANSIQSRNDNLHLDENNEPKFLDDMLVIFNEVAPVLLKRMESFSEVKTDSEAIEKIGEALGPVSNTTFGQLKRLTNSFPETASNMVQDSKNSKEIVMNAVEASKRSDETSIIKSIKEHTDKENTKIVDKTKTTVSLLMDHFNAVYDTNTTDDSQPDATSKSESSTSDLLKLIRNVINDEKVVGSVSGLVSEITDLAGHLESGEIEEQNVVQVSQPDLPNTNSPTSNSESTKKTGLENLKQSPSPKNNNVRTVLKPKNSKGAPSQPISEPKEVKKEQPGSTNSSTEEKADKQLPNRVFAVLGNMFNSFFGAKPDAK